MVVKNLELGLHRIVKEVSCIVHGNQNRLWIHEKGFSYTTLALEEWRDYAKKEGLDERKLVVEILRIGSELPTHYHNRSTSVVAVLGDKHGYPTPSNALGYLGNGWAHLREGDVLRIPKGMTHGFKAGGVEVFYLLAVQSPSTKNDTYYVTLP